MAFSKYSKTEAKSAARDLLVGAITAPCLPVHPNGDIDEDGLRHDIRHLIDVIGTSGLYMNGYYGHYWLLSREQRRRVIEITVEENAGAVPIIARCAYPSPREATDLALHAQGLGVDFISLVSPQFGGADREAFFGYFRAIADEIDLGITVFNTTQAGYSISPEMMAELAEIPNICALKNGMSIAHTIRVRELVGDSIVVVDPEEENFFLSMSQFGQRAIYTGTNAMFDSAKSQPMKDYIAAALAGDMQLAARRYYDLQPVRDMHRKWILTPWWGTGLCPIARVKQWNQLLGMTGGPVPAGLPSMSDAEKDQMAADLESVGLPVS